MEVRLQQKQQQPQRQQGSHDNGTCSNSTQKTAADAAAKAATKASATSQRQDSKPNKLSHHAARHPSVGIANTMQARPRVADMPCQRVSPKQQQATKAIATRITDKTENCRATAHCSSAPMVLTCQP